MTRMMTRIMIIISDSVRARAGGARFGASDPELEMAGQGNDSECRDLKVALHGVNDVGTRIATVVAVTASSGRQGPCHSAVVTGTARRSRRSHRRARH